MKNIVLFQPQYAVELRNETNYWLPYSAACLWSYAKQYKHITDCFVLDRIFYRRSPLIEVVDQIDQPAICGFSCYVWNEQYCLQAAKTIKEKWPACLMVFGGPQVNAQFLDHDFVDSVILGEGEESFLRILENHSQGLPVDPIYTQSRIQNLDIPSPYNSGVFDQIIQENPDTVWAMTLESNRGCPYACTFCDWGSTTYSKIKTFDLGRIQQDLDWAKKHRIAYIFLADANFGILKDRDLEIAKMIRQAADDSMIEAVNLQYAKNGTEQIFKLAQIVGKYGRGVTVSVQSMNDSTLAAIKRSNLEINNIRTLLALSEKYQVGTYTEVILGLPNETKDTWVQGLNQLLELGQHQSIDVWFAQLLQNSELNNPITKQIYGIQSTRVKDYMALNQDNDSIVEYIDIIKATDTLPTHDLIDCYMYAWMIVHFHTAGYSQIIARYCRNVMGIDYQKFYDALLRKIHGHDIMNKHYQELRQIVCGYLEHGQLDDLSGGHALHARSYGFVYKHKQEIYHMAMANARELCDKVDEDLLILQHNFVFSPGQSPSTVTTNYNVYTGQLGQTVYRFTPQIAQLQQDDFYSFRRKGLLKNKVDIS